jgi:hypothetical protein
MQKFTYRNPKILAHANGQECQNCGNQDGRQYLGLALVAQWELLQQCGRIDDSGNEHQRS